MYPQTSPHPGKGYELLHKFRFFLFEFSKLICHNNQMRQGFSESSFPVKSLIGIYMINLHATGFRSLLKGAKTPFVFTFKGNQRPLNIHTYICNLSHYMGKSLQKVSHTSPLIIN